MEPQLQRNADLLETPLDDPKTLIAERLKRPSKPAAPDAAGGAAAASQLYLIYDQRDTEAIAPWQEYFFQRGIEVLPPLFEGDEADVREYHEENLRICDAVVVVHGAAAESWLRRKLREIQKSAGLGRTKPKPMVAICLAPPKTPDKERFRTLEALVLPMWDGMVGDPLHAVVDRLKVVGR